MNATRYPFLDLVALPAVGRALFDARPALLCSGDGERVLWANAAGAAWLGAATIPELLERSFNPRNPAVREIERLSKSQPADAERLARLRFLKGLTTLSVTARCTRLVLADGASALLVVALDAGSLPAGDPVGRLVTALAGEDLAVAVFDRHGERISASGAYAEMAPPDAAMLPLRSELDLDPARAVKRVVEIDGVRWRAGVARVSSDRGPVDLVILGLAAGSVEKGSGKPETPEPVAAWSPEATDAPIGTPAGDEPAAKARVIETPSEPVAAAAPTVVEPTLVAAETEAESETAAEPEPAPEPVMTIEPEVVPEIAEAVAETGPEIEPQAPPAPVAPIATPSAPAPLPGASMPTGPVRFVWHMDADQRFTSVSPELAAVVGARSAAIVGKRWSEVAQELGLETEAIDRALGRRDTWSGVTVYWPVDDRAIRIAVDLAALPAFARDRRFDGFRGFGVARPADVRPPVEVPAATATDGPADIPEAELDRRMEEADRAEASRTGADRTASLAPVPPAPANVVPLRGETRGVDTRLSGSEKDAFRAIGRALGKSGEDGPAERETGPAKSRETRAETPKVDEPKVEPAPPAPAPPAVAAFDPAILDRLPLGILVFRDGAVLYANRALLDLSGYESAAALGSAGGLEALFPGGAGAARPLPEDRIEARRKDGSAVPVEARLNSIAWQGSSAFLMSLRDAPEPKRPDVDAALKAELDAASGEIEELTSILDTATDGVVVIDGVGTILSLNRSAEALFGVETDNVVGTPFTGLLAEESRKAALDYLDGLARNGVASVLNDGREVIGKVPQGGLIPLFMTMGRVGETGKFCAVVRDITQWKNAEEELTAARRAAEVANSQKSEFLAKISHEIRTPLNAIIGFADMMKEERFGPIGNDRYREYLRDIHLSGTHLMSLINDLLDLSKIEAGKLELDFGAVAANLIIQECVALMQPHANRERIIIRTSLAAGLPDVVADARALRQIVLNLLSNAVKFTEAGGQVIVSTALEGTGEVTIRIRDTGIGMSEKDIETAMKPFRQITTAANRGEGTGLGLPLTKALVEANRATFSIESAPSQGTLIRIAFPSTRVLAG